MAIQSGYTKAAADNWDAVFSPKGEAPSLPLEVFARGTTNDGKRADPEKVIGYACPECRLFFSTSIFRGCRPEESSKRAAAEHCNRRCQACDVKLPKERLTYTHCPDCRVKLAEQSEREAFDNAEKIHESAWGGPVYWDGHGPDDGHFTSVDAVREYCEDHGLDLPRYVNATEPHRLHLDADSILDSALEEHHEGAYDQCDVDGLQKLLNGWCTAQKVTSYHEDPSRVVLLDGEDDA
jgi:predicted RNA-binding Zn-ribbon protein involved in translation (DUF1610 family)